MHVWFVTLSSQGVLPRPLVCKILASEALFYLDQSLTAYICPKVLQYLKEIPAIMVKQVCTANRGMTKRIENFTAHILLLAIA